MPETKERYHVGQAYITGLVFNQWKTQKDFEAQLWYNARIEVATEQPGCSVCNQTENDQIEDEEEEST